MDEPNKESGEDWRDSVLLSPHLQKGARCHLSAGQSDWIRAWKLVILSEAVFDIGSIKIGEEQVRISQGKNMDP